MRFKYTILLAAGLLGLPVYTAIASLGDGQTKLTKTEAVQGTEVAARLRHTHRHCHVTVTWGHAKRRCHTHRHNKVAHHGLAYH